MLSICVCARVGMMLVAMGGLGTGCDADVLQVADVVERLKEEAGLQRVMAERCSSSAGQWAVQTRHFSCCVWGAR